MSDDARAAGRREGAPRETGASPERIELGGGYYFASPRRPGSQLRDLCRPGGSVVAENVFDDEAHAFAAAIRERAGAAGTTGASELENERQYAHKLQCALTGVAGGGSENFVRHGDGFRADIPACIARIYERRDSMMASVRGFAADAKAEKKRADATEAELAAIRAENERLRETVGLQGGIV